MVTIKNRIENDIKEAMRGKEELRLSALRMVFSSIHNKEIEKRAKGGSADLTDEEVVAVLRSEVKKRKDAREGFEKGGRTDAAEKEKTEAKIIESYLPAELSEEEVERIVKEVVSSMGDVSQKDFGRVMGEVMKRAKGQASGERVSVFLKKALEK